MKNLFYWLLIAFMLTIARPRCAYAQQTSPKGYVQPIAWVATGPSGLWAFTRTDANGNLFTSGAPAGPTGQTPPTAYVTPFAPVVQDATGAWHFMKVDGSGNLQTVVTFPLTSPTANPAIGDSNSQLNLAKTDKVCWRNQNNTANVCITLSAANNITVPGVLVGTSAVAVIGTPINQVGQSGSLGAQTLVASTANAGAYVIHYYLDESAGCSSPGSGAVLATFSWTDASNGRTQATSLLPFTVSLGTGNFLSAAIPIWSATASAITFTTTYTVCTTGTATYDIHAWVTQAQ